ncbi:MAG: DUF6514 family protein [Oscillospiraceae bacterium]|nr:DUF6514 family protein [Oscillospiraceae bacterium]
MNTHEAWTYAAFQRRYFSKENGAYFSYSVRASGASVSGKRIVYEVDDVCLDEPRVRELVQLCNSLELEPCHLMDVIEDWLP